MVFSTRKFRVEADQKQTFRIRIDFSPSRLSISNWDYVNLCVGETLHEQSRTWSSSEFHIV